jgi:hypothetical protein
MVDALSFAVGLFTGVGIAAVVVLILLIIYRKEIIAFTTRVETKVDAVQKALKT